jgi:hypothetical protein
MDKPIYTKRGRLFEYVFTPADQDKYRSWYNNLVADIGASIAADKVVPEFHMHSSAESLINKLSTFYEDFEVYMLCNYWKEQYAYVALEKGGVSPHVDGSVWEIALCISNMEDKAPLASLMRRIIKQAKFESIDWLITHKHVGPYEYRARYHKLNRSL